MKHINIFILLALVAFSLNALAAPTSNLLIQSDWEVATCTLWIHDSDNAIVPPVETIMMDRKSDCVNPDYNKICTLLVHEEGSKIKTSDVTITDKFGNAVKFNFSANGQDSHLYVPNIYTKATLLDKAGKIISASNFERFGVVTFPSGDKAPRFRIECGGQNVDYGPGMN